ncbi:MAG: hypothetical protein HY757_08270 [Nitrospirae bacterium]|nr:hypothetical protein [Nitrospirota bacterium]
MKLKKGNKKKSKETFYKKTKTLFLFFLTLLLGAIIQEAIGLKLWPNILIVYDTITGKKPDLAVTLTIRERIHNNNYIDYLNKCDGFHTFLINSGLASKLPSDSYFVKYVNAIQKESPYCMVSSIVPSQFNNSIENHFFRYPNYSDNMGCQECKEFNILIGNNGQININNIRARIRLNRNWVIISTTGEILEERDPRTLAIQKNEITENDTLNAIAYLKDITGKKADWGNFIEKLRITYEWHGIERTLNNNRILLIYEIDIDNCKACCQNNKIGNFEMLEWDGFENVCKQK